VTLDRVCSKIGYAKTIQVDQGSEAARTYSFAREAPDT